MHPRVGRERRGAPLRARTRAGAAASEAPPAGGALSRVLARGLLRLAGWRIDGDAATVPKLVLVGAPHTTNLDFVLAKLTAAALGVRLSWVGKASLFRGPFGWVGRRLGGIPVDRAASEGFVAAMVDEFRRRERFYLALTVPLLPPPPTRAVRRTWSARMRTPPISTAAWPTTDSLLT